MTNSAIDKDVPEVDQTSEKSTVWFVREGRMHSSWILGHMDLNVEIHASNSFKNPREIALEILTDIQETRRTISIDTRLNEMVKRPGRWYYLAGCNTVHSDDIYATKELAAEAYKNFLLG